MLQRMPAPDRHAHRARHAPAVLQTLGRLPSRLLKRALLLTHTVGLQTADDGQWQRALARPQDPPLFDLHAWLLDDWGVDDSDERRAFEAALFVAVSVDFLAANLRQGRLDAHSFFDAGDRPLEDELARQARLHWRRAVPEKSVFWTHHRESVAADNPAGSELQRLLTLPAVATALWAGREAVLPALLSYGEIVGDVLQFVEHLSCFRRDLENDHVSPPLQRALGARGVAGQSAPGVPAALAALLLTGTLDQMLQEHHGRIADARRIAIGLELPNLQAHADELDALLYRVRGIFGLSGGVAPADTASRRAFFAPAPAVLDNVLQKAEGYLLADPSLREAWEVQHHSCASPTTIVARVFAPCVIVDILGSHGHNVAGAVKELLETYQSQGFRYYDHTHLLVPDIDSLALAWRLVPHARHPARYRDAFQAPLRWLRENQWPSGGLPVWLYENDSPPALAETAVLYGARCATVEANLMSSLIGHGWPEHRELVEAGARDWCRRWLDVGLGACEHYTPMYSLWAATEVVSQLLARTDDEELQRLLNALGPRLSQRFVAEAARDDLSPQDAALLMLASLRTQALPYDNDWVTLLFKHQRHDGCWEGEPFYVVPTGRHLSTQWYASRSVTTALVYHALKHHQLAVRRRAAPIGGASVS